MLSYKCVMVEYNPPMVALLVCWSASNANRRRWTTLAVVTTDNDHNVSSFTTSSFSSDFQLWCSYTCLAVLKQCNPVLQLDH